MSVTDVWTPAGPVDIEPAGGPLTRDLRAALAACSNADLGSGEPGAATGDPPEVALLQLAREFGADCRFKRAKRGGCAGSTSTPYCA
jgi:hypothetical protein